MNRPERLNAADEEMHRELVDVWRDIDRADDVDVAILRGAGRGFSAGGDLDMVEHIADDWSTRARVWREARDLVYNVIDCSKPIVSAMQGQIGRASCRESEEIARVDVCLIGSRTHG